MSAEQIAPPSFTGCSRGIEHAKAEGVNLRGSETSRGRNSATEAAKMSANSATKRFKKKRSTRAVSLEACLTDNAVTAIKLMDPS